MSKVGYLGELIFDYDSNEKVWTRNKSCGETNFSHEGPASRYTIFTIYTGDEKFEKIIYVHSERRWYFLNSN